MGTKRNGVGVSDSGSSLVYSTDSGRRREQKESKGSSPPTGSGPCKMRLERKGRGGKAVTILFNLPFEADEAKRRMRELQTKLGCGASYKNGTIEFQGDVRERIKQHFAAVNEKIVLAGG